MGIVLVCGNGYLYFIKMKEKKKIYEIKEYIIILKKEIEGK